MVVRVRIARHGTYDFALVSKRQARIGYRLPDGWVVVGLE